MAFREVRVYEVREVLRLWLDGEGLRSIERLSAVDRKTVRRYVTAAEGLGLVRDDGVVQLGDEFVAAVVEVVRPHRSDGHGHAWQRLVAEHEIVAGWVAEDLTGVKIHELLARRVWWCRCARCSVMSVTSAAGAEAAARRCASPMVSQAMSCRSTSVGWVTSMSRAAGGWCGR
jgi:hypothetical protein